MASFWKIYRSINQHIPKSVIERARSFAEAHFNFLWRKISFSQFGEDIVLLELLNRRSIKQGFYVDVGAFAPKQFSNTYLLYRRGWRGINIDATPNSMKVFDKVRNRDINLEVAISDEEREVTFYSWGSPTVCNTLSKAHAEHFTAVIGKPPVEKTVSTRRLAKVLDEYSDRFSTIDVMNIDVEDHTIEVFESNDWNKYRPRILVVEIEGSSIEEILASKENVFLSSRGYKMQAWTNPTVFYELALPLKVSKDGVPG